MATVDPLRVKTKPRRKQDGAMAPGQTGQGVISTGWWEVSTDWAQAGEKAPKSNPPVQVRRETQEV